MEHMLVTILRAPSDPDGTVRSVKHKSGTAQ